MVNDQERTFRRAMDAILVIGIISACLSILIILTVEQSPLSRAAVSAFRLIATICLFARWWLPWTRRHHE